MFRMDFVTFRLSFCCHILYINLRVAMCYVCELLASITASLCSAPICSSSIAILFYNYYNYNYCISALKSQMPVCSRAFFQERCGIKHQVPPKKLSHSQHNTLAVKLSRLSCREKKTISSIMYFVLKCNVLGIGSDSP